ncbi:MAG TPA: acyl-CoA thioesterase [Beijerinckiaceae bacterium]|nr:acyl-CoA thioesterase [Beijerinckiaceae bacterium]
MIIARREILIEWGDCDPAGIVFNPRYFEWFDACAAGLFAQAGLTKLELTDCFGIVGIPLVETRAKFLLSSRWGERVSIESQIITFRRSSFDLRHRLLRGSQEAVIGEETRVWAARHPDDSSRLKSQPVPDQVKALFGLGG